MEPQEIVFCKGGGCTAKLGPGILARVLNNLPKTYDPNLLIGFDGSDDAAVYKLTDDLAIVQTLDFFPPMVEDPYIFGQIAAANALSDIYAMGGDVKTALNIVCFPEAMDLNILGKIMLGGSEKVREAGGLYIIGTERHESRRIDNQLKGRAGRQGDPGVSKFFLSTEDDLMRLFGGDRMKMVMERLNVEDDMPIDAKLISYIIDSSQENIELRNFGMRKDVLLYDDVLNKQREIIYGQRDQVLNGEDLHDTIYKMIEDTIDTSVKQYLPDGPREHWNLQSLKDYFKDIVHGKITRYEMPTISALNFVMEDALGGGVTRSLAVDMHGKTLGSALLEMEID